MEDMVPGKRGRGRHRRLWIQDLSLDDAGRLAQNRDAFRAAVMETAFLERIRHMMMIYQDIRKQDRWPVIREAGPVAFDAKLTKLPLKNLKIQGFFQSFRYFKDVEDEIRQEFTFQDSVANEADRILHDLYAKNKVSFVVGVHVRRGDFLSKNNQYWGYGVPEKSYFIKAFDWMRAKFPGRNITFLVASDDFKWCNENLIGNSVVALPSASAAVHMAILTSCNHVIISGGTYGYWCAFMARGGYVIYYTGYLASNTPLGKEFTPNDYYRPLWIGFGN